jgi:plastocyanin
MMMEGAQPTTGEVPMGCGQGPGEQNVPGSAIAGLPRIVIGIHDEQFLPAQISVQPGTVVVWRNFGSQPHTTTSWSRWESQVMFPGDRCAAWFVTPGTYEYLSIVAADGGRLRGSITVEGPPVGGGAAETPMPGQPGTGPGPLMPGVGGFGY